MSLRDGLYATLNSPPQVIAGHVLAIEVVVENAGAPIATVCGGAP